MGCFSFRCGLSGLPIHSGEPVRWLLLTAANPKGCPPGERTESWSPRIIPVPGHYNDYGSLEYPRTPSNRLLRELVKEGLEVDLVERGWGGSGEVPTTRQDFRHFDRILRAAYRGRILVREIGYHPRHRDVPAGVPTRRRVERVLRRAGLRAAVSEQAPGRVTVRARAWGDGPYSFLQMEGYGDEKDALLDVKGVLEEAAPGYVLELKGAGEELRLIVRTPEPLPRTVRGYQRPRPHHIRVAQAMVREDVWRGSVALFLPRAARDQEVERLRKRLPTMRLKRPLYPPHLQAIMDETDALVGRAPEPQERAGGWNEFALASCGSVELGVSSVINPTSSLFFLAGRVRSGSLDLNSREVTEALGGLVEVTAIHRNVGGFGGVGPGWRPHHGIGQETLWDREAPWREMVARVARGRLEEEIQRHSEPGSE